jgi:orotate phosphoribosyltransferase
MNNIKYIFKGHPIILDGHFKLRSGLHSNTYINKDAIYCNYLVYKTILMKLRILIRDEFPIEAFNIITGPAIAGAILASTLSLNFKKTFIYPEKDSNGNMKFNRGYDKIITDKKVLIIEDIITTGKSVNSVITAIQDCGGTAIGIMSIWNRSNVKFTISNFSLITDEIPIWDSKICPLCQKYINLTDPKTGNIIYE